MTYLYCDPQIFEEYKASLETATDEALVENFEHLTQLCIKRIAGEIQFTFEQMVNIYTVLRNEIDRLMNYGSLKSMTDLNQFPTQVQLTYNLQAKKLKEYHDSKNLDLMNKRRQK